MKPISFDQAEVLRAIHEHGPLFGPVRSALWNSKRWSVDVIHRHVRGLARDGFITLVRKPANDARKWRVRLTQTGRDFAMVEDS